METIARIYTDFPQKFGIPRQSGLVPELRGRIVFEPEYAREEAVRGLEGFSHIWLIWMFEGNDRCAQDLPETHSTTSDATHNAEHSACDSACADTHNAPRASRKDNSHCAHPASHRCWQPMVRPPILGGNKQMGVFATRSPFRPNPLGLSCVQLERIELTPCGPVLHVRGADLRNGTPIFDIKPYLPTADCHPDATGGFTDTTSWQRLQVECPPELLERVPEASRTALLGVLAEDPRPARQKAHEGKRYTLSFAGLDVRFSVTNTTLTVHDIEHLPDNPA